MTRRKEIESRLFVHERKIDIKRMMLGSRNKQHSGYIKRTGIRPRR